MRFLSTLVASIIGTLVALGVVIVFGLLFIASVAVSSRVEPSVRSGSVLVMDLSGYYPEFSDQTLADLGSRGGAMTVRELIEAIEKATNDARIDGIWLKPLGVSASWASLLEVRRALSDFASSGKILVASSGAAGFSERDYFLASSADSVFGVPEGSFEMNGFFLTVTFYAGLLEKLDVEPLVVRAGNFKSAVEPFLRSDLSEENDEQLRRIVDQVDSVFAATIADSRGLSFDSVRQIVTDNSAMSTRVALELGLVDGLKYQDDVWQLLAARFGVEETNLSEVRLSQYRRVSRETAGLKQGTEGTVSVVYASGPIQSGNRTVDPLSGESVIAEKTYLDLIDGLRRSDAVDAVVLRIDSPGGSAAASDAIWNSLQRLADSKPLVVSMGGVAASGGYYIAAPARRIFAEPLTITGSIGVFGLMLNTAPVFEEHLGITFDGVRSAPHADMFSGIRSWTAEERAMMEREVDDTYETFLDRVARGRRLEPASVDLIGAGRVWMGTDAVRNGLVDELGGLEEAVAFAARSAGLEEGTYRLRIHPRPRSVLEQIDQMLPRTLASLGIGSRSTSSSIVEPLAAYLEELVRLGKTMAIEARMPFRLDVH